VAGVEQFREVKFLLDANVCILLLGGLNRELNARALDCAPGEMAISAIAFAEVVKGSWQGKLPPLHMLDSFVEDVALLPFDEGAARAYARLPFRRASFDRLIAAHAISRGLILITVNERDFADIEGLRMENWTK